MSTSTLILLSCCSRAPRPVCRLAGRGRFRCIVTWHRRRCLSCRRREAVCRQVRVPSVRLKLQTKEEHSSCASSPSRRRWLRRGARSTAAALEAQARVQGGHTRLRTRVRRRSRVCRRRYVGLTAHCGLGSCSASVVAHHCSSAAASPALVRICSCSRAAGRSRLSSRLPVLSHSGSL